MGYKTKAHFYAVAAGAGIAGPLKFERLSSGAAILYDEGRYIVIYGDTIILNHKDGQFTLLNNGGYYTMTTKKWINRGLAGLGLSNYIQQKAGAWYVVNGDEKVPFQSMMQL